jgi:hypothetical protein
MMTPASASAISGRAIAQLKEDTPITQHSADERREQKSGNNQT